MKSPVLVRWLAVLVLCAGAGGCSWQAQREGQATRIVQARLLTQPGDGLTTPPAGLREASLPEAGWQDVALPHAVPRELEAQPPGATRSMTHWYRVDTPSDPPAGPLYLYVPRWKNGGQIAVYGDGRLLYQTEGSLAHNGYNRPLLIRLNQDADHPPPAAVMLRLERLQTNNSVLSAVWMGPAQALAWRYQVRQFLQVQLPFMGAAAFLAVGLFSLAIWAWRRHESLYLLFFAVTAVAFVRMLHYFVGGSYLPLSDEWFHWLTVTSLLWLIVFTHNFLERLHRQPLPWLTPTLAAVTLACSLVSMPGASSLVPSLDTITPSLYLALLPLSLLIFADALRHAWRSRKREVVLMTGWVFLTVASSAYDLALQNNRVSPEGLYTNPYALIGLFVMFNYIMFRRYLGAIGAVERLNAGLAERLEVREAELAKSYEKLRAVEQQQMLSKERQRMMQDMHDGLGSSLTSAIRSVEHGTMSDAEVSQLLKDCMDDLKLAIDSIEPVEADLLLLLATLRFRLEPRIEGAGADLRWEVREIPTLDWLDPSSALHILRIVQEAVANVLRHTRATEIRVSTGPAEGGVQVSIEDNGQGFDVDKAHLEPTGRGLGNQVRRAMALRGRAHWQSGPTGTRFTLWLPLQRPADPAL
jgi:signal transduction histidine kinase